MVTDVAGIEERGTGATRGPDAEPTRFDPASGGEGRSRRGVPPVSVLMPVYNAERYVAEAVESILAQTFADFEFLILDDGSTDGSRAILERYAGRDRRIQLVGRSNRGIVATLNELVARSRGELLARMDADDVASPDRLEQQVRFLSERPDHVMVGSRATIIDPDGSPLAVLPIPLDHEELDRALIEGRGQMIYHPAALFRRGPLLSVGPYREEFAYAEDLDLFLRLAEVGRIANLPEPLLKYREHFGKLGRVRAAPQAAAIRAVLEAARRRRGLPHPGGWAAAEPRPIGEAESRRSWAWWALGHGNVASARRHAWAGFVGSPLSLDSWRVLYCAMRGY